MTVLILGLLLFLGLHSVRIVADGWRSALMGLEPMTTGITILAR